jgi:stage V sporulation protein G
LNITDVRIKLISKYDNKVKALASVTFDDVFVVHDVKVILGNKDSLFVSMPTRKDTNGEFRDIAHPLNIEFRKYLCDTVLEHYHRTVNESI